MTISNYFSQSTTVSVYGATKDHTVSAQSGTDIYHYGSWSDAVVYNKVYARVSAVQRAGYFNFSVDLSDGAKYPNPEYHDKRIFFIGMA